MCSVTHGCGLAYPENVSFALTVVLMIAFSWQVLMKTYIFILFLFLCIT